MYLQKIISIKTLKNYFFVGILKVNDENSRIRIRDPDPDPLVRGMDEHCLRNRFLALGFLKRLQIRAMIFHLHKHPIPSTLLYPLLQPHAVFWVLGTYPIYMYSTHTALVRMYRYCSILGLTPSITLVYLLFLHKVCTQLSFEYMLLVNETLQQLDISFTMYQFFYKTHC